jgi:SAM-dependent methyltransferase
MTLSSRLEELYWMIERWITPGLRPSQDTYKDVLDDHVAPHIRWLDLGCGHAVLPPWHQARERQIIARCKFVVGLDRSLRSLKKHATIAARVCGDIATLPFLDRSFDLVPANMVVEHLADPAAEFAEIRRVLVPGGTFLCHTPNTFGYPTVCARLVPEPLKKPLIRLLQGRDATDVFETYYRANSRQQLTRIAEASGLHGVGVRMVLSSAEFLRVTPLAVLELLWIRALMSAHCEALRPTIIATFTRRGASTPPTADDSRPVVT